MKAAALICTTCRRTEKDCCGKTNWASLTAFCEGCGTFHPITKIAGQFVYCPWCVARKVAEFAGVPR